MSGKPSERVRTFDPRLWQFDLGRKSFLRGEPNIAEPPESEFVGPLTPRAARWLGWMFARACQLMRDNKIRDWAENDGELP